MMIISENVVNLFILLLLYVFMHILFYYLNLIITKFEYYLYMDSESKIHSSLSSTDEPEVFIQSKMFIYIKILMELRTIFSSTKLWELCNLQFLSQILLTFNQVL